MVNEGPQQGAVAGGEFEALSISDIAKHDGDAGLLARRSRLDDLASYLTIAPPARSIADADVDEIPHLFVDDRVEGGQGPRMVVGVEKFKHRPTDPVLGFHPRECHCGIVEPENRTFRVDDDNGIGEHLQDAFGRR